MARTLLIVAMLAALVTTTAASAARGKPRSKAVLSSTTTELMPGVTYTREVDMTAAGPVVLDVVTAPKPDGTVYSLAPALSNNRIVRTEKLTAMETRLHPDATTVGIDGDYFNADGQPNSLLVEGGVLENPPNAGRTSLGISADGTLQAAQVSFFGTWQASAGQRQLSLNSLAGHFALFTPAYGRATPDEWDTVKEAVFSKFPPTQAGQDLSGTVAKLTSDGETPIPRGGAVLVARGSNYAKQLETEAPVGEPVTVHLTLTPDWSGLASALGGGPLLVEDGKAVFSNGETFRPGFLQTRSARGAVGQLADGRIVLVTAEAATPEYSVGLSSYDLALELVKLGAVTAVGLGSGPQAGMAFDGSLLTRPSTGAEKSISDALVLSYTGVYAAPVAPMFSPNGDGVGDTEKLSYRLVRPATVTATLNGPNGATVPLVSGPVKVGVHKLIWDGTLDGSPQPEGAWTFSVSATDDRSITTKAERTLTLDNTLGSLTVAADKRGDRTAQFVLTREADVVVRVEQRNGGVTLATYHLRHALAGAHRVTWNGKIGKKRAPAGSYLMRVDATSTIGTSSLVAPISLG